MVGLVVGFAARATLANAIAGIMLAITQPIRIGDLVTFEDETGEVEDVRLTYTYLRLDDGSRLVVPNERLAQGAIENHTVVDPRVQVEVSVWIPPGRGRGPRARADRLRGGGRGRDRGRGGQGRRPAQRHHLGGRTARARTCGRRAARALAPPAP